MTLVAFHLWVKSVRTLALETHDFGMGLMNHPAGLAQRETVGIP